MYVAVVGCGLLGRLTALACITRGWKVCVIDKNRLTDETSCSFSAGGMLSPYCEAPLLSTASQALYQNVFEQWRLILKQMGAKVTLNRGGTRLTSHPRERNIIQHELARIKQHCITPLRYETCSGGFHLEGEGYIDNQAWLHESTVYLRRHCDAIIEDNEISRVDDRVIHLSNRKPVFDLVFDTRGIGSANTSTGLRGVSGETLLVHAPDVQLAHTVRYYHPRYPLYIVPRPNQHYILGATEIQSDEIRGMSVRSALTLLSMACAVDARFQEAVIVKHYYGVRPTFDDGQPSIQINRRIIRINGAYRHGYLIGPGLVEKAFTHIQKGVFA